jgi:hypothetical protein
MSDQKNWDAAVISTWRRGGNVQDALFLFQGLSGKQLSDCDPPLKRIPPTTYPWKIGIRVFVANHLSKISKRLWEQTPDKDILLLRKLETSSYDTETDKIDDLALAREREQDKRNRKKVAMSALEYSNRNQATDWGVTKGSAKIKMRRR